MEKSMKRIANCLIHLHFRGRHIVDIDINATIDANIAGGTDMSRPVISSQRHSFCAPLAESLTHLGACTL